ncbi:putative hyoscyamine (6S)-dioxygenase [Helianthus annuus]|nr:putative hyoscyamine (6S)-dioxygenase [Helianthus annuus]KAJ0597322.1 putative hyoscyamine (6S)-dioxygenase [Helianthus annuus]
MEKLLSSWSSTVKSLPESYVFPVDSRPGDTTVPFCNTLPVVDLARDRHDAVQQILRACQDYGLFQVCNICFLMKWDRSAITLYYTKVLFVP